MAEVQFPMKGVQIWKNPRNKFMVFQLHYTADPEKRDPQWAKDIAAKLPRRKFLQEYELMWDSYAGLPVYGSWNRVLHGSEINLEPHVGLPLLRGWDFGLTPACIVAQLQGSTLCILREFVDFNKGANTFVPEVIEKCNSIYPFWSGRRDNWKDFIDPSGEFRKDTDLGACALIMDSHGLTPIPGAVAFEPRRSAVEYYLNRLNKGQACFQVDIGRCPILVRGFDGGYRYNDKMVDIEPKKIRPIKDEHSHPHDALQYICCRVKMLERRVIDSVRTPGYSFSSGRR